ncbi:MULTISPECIES: hemolysin family protein [unclassified Paenibacillus]|uniref:hemolysin family protein n=1 Tax=unclassified Paenibacillus TaxID=185978 RepID=UPI001AE8ED72|nr:MULTISPECIES: hemolysin family protein [unclassified Paenibacillus]MBP1157639.1 putative hemolysin [Paenibacillus sp. PvP091]MBP1171624.1 putative hemolysin [Paenibacillus sp. PvR098]MBP2438005.1 putative hemolysin [Paenibacillus sp. PvP052]
MEIIILIVLILLNAFFAASEIALISLNDNKVKLMAEEGNKKAVMLYKLLKEPSRFLATIQIGITLAGFMASAFAAESFAGSLARVIYETGVPIPQATLETISVIFITLILSYFTLVFGELVPKRLAMKKAEAISMIAVRPLTLLSVITSPFVKLLTGSTNVIVRLFGVDPHANDEQVTEEEIRMMVDVGKERGTIQENEKMMIDNIFEFDNKVVSDIMTHRTNIVAIPITASLKEVIQLIHMEKYTRFPVFEKGIDNIVGILHVKDIILCLEGNHEQVLDIKDVIRKPYLIPAAKRIDELFKDLQRDNVHMAIAIDEYGGTAGIVTIEDLLEEIVGNIFDEHDEEEKEIIVIDDNTFMVQGTTNLDDVEKFLNVELETDEYETLSGFLIGQLGRIPDQGENPVLEWNGIVFKVEEADEKRILKVKVCRAV